MSQHRSAPLELTITGGTPWARTMALAAALKASLSDAQAVAPGDCTYDALDDADGTLTDLIDELESAWTLDHPDPATEAELAFERHYQRNDELRGLEV